MDSKPIEPATNDVRSVIEPFADAAPSKRQRSIYSEWVRSLQGDSDEAFADALQLACGVPDAADPPVYHVLQAPLSERRRATRIASLLMLGWSPNAMIKRGGSRRAVLFEALMLGAENSAQVLIEAGARTSVRTTEGATLLHAAAWGGLASITRLLLTRRVPLEAEDTDGVRALHLASHQGHAAVVRVLLEAGAAVDAAVIRGPWQGLRAIDLAREHGASDVVKLLAT